MITYSLVCRKGHAFEGWFASSTAFEDQALAGRVTCPVCNSKKVSKAPMAPAVAGTKKSRTKTAPPEAGPAELRKLLLRLRSHVEANAENVGARFAEEARAIHEGEATERPIYGDATPEETEALRDCGIAVSAIPWVEKGDA